jgi:hypothetical protein
VLRTGAVCAIAGAVVLLVANAAHPRPARSELDDHGALLRIAADSDAWLVIHAGILLGVVLFLGALAAIAHSLREDGGAAFARLALVSTAAAGGLSLVQHSLDTAYGEIADDWAAASGSEKDTLFHIGSVVEDIDFTMLAVNDIVFFGVTFALFGIAVSRGRLYPRPLGWAAILAAAGAAASGIAQLFTGPSVVTLYVFPAFAAVLSVWLLVMGVLLRRHA